MSLPYFAGVKSPMFMITRRQSPHMYYGPDYPPYMQGYCDMGGYDVSLEWRVGQEESVAAMIATHMPALAEMIQIATRQLEADRQRAAQIREQRRRAARMENCPAG